MRISDWSSDVCSSDLIGYGLHLPADLEADRRYRYHSEHGARPVAVAEAGAYRGLSLVELRDGQFSSTATRADARRLLREAIAAQPGGRPLATPRLLRDMRAKAAKLEASNTCRRVCLKPRCMPPPATAQRLIPSRLFSHRAAP